MSPSNSLKDANTVEIFVGDELLDLAHAIAKLAYAQTLNLRDLIEPGRTLEVIVSVIT
jgi:hypothetical protein